MVTLHQRLITEIWLSNPRLSPEEVSDQIATLVENEILPRVLTTIRLPPLPSPLHVKREELMGRRYGKLSVRRPLYEKASFLQELEKLRLRFNGSDMTNEDFFDVSMNNTQTQFAGGLRFDVPPPEKTLSVKSEVMQKRLRFTPSFGPRNGWLKKPSRLVSFDSSISGKIARDPLFEKIIGQVERGIRSNYGHESLKVFFSFSTRTDIDDPEREKTIIRISLPAHSFDEKMELWKKIEADIREVIRKLDVTEQERKAINRNLFTHMEPA